MGHKNRILLHLSFWLAYVSFKIIQNAEPSDMDSEFVFTWPLFKKLLYVQLSYLIVKVPLVYSLFFTANRYLTKDSSISRVIGFAFGQFSLALLLYIVIKQRIVLPLAYGIHPSIAEGFNFFSILYALYILCFISVLALAIKMVRYNIRQRNEANELKQGKLEAELKFLKAQTNPHFLFNTLNNIYSLARKKSEDTADVVMKLSKLFRFMLFESDNNAITLEKEVQVVEDYIELERLRYPPGRLQVRFAKQIDNPSSLIAPLILLPFVENAFKHSASESLRESVIEINLSVRSNRLEFIIQNSHQATVSDQPSRHIGLTNIRRQLELLYPNHILHIENNTDVFAVTLNLTL